MTDWIAGGCKLGWLVDLTSQTVTIYRPDKEPEVVSAATSLSGEDVLPGFTLDLADFV